MLPPKTNHHTSTFGPLGEDQLMRALIVNSKDAISLSDSELIIGYISPAITDILGYTPEELIGTPSSRLMHPAEIDEKIDIRRSIAPGSTVHMHLRAKHKNGSWRWLDISTTNYLDNPAIRAMVTNIRDVTDKKNTEEALLHSERKYRALIENNREGIALTGPDRKFTYISPQITDMLGYEPDELIGSHPLDMYHPDDHARIFTFVESISDDKPHSIDHLRVRCKDGRWKWLELTFCDQFDNPSVNAMVCNFRDMTEKKAAEEALINSERRFRTLIENNKEGIGLTDHYSRFIYLSPSSTRILGYSPEELIGSVAFERYHPDDLPLMKALATSIREQPGRYATATVRILHKDGTWRWIELISNNQLDDPAVNAVVTNFRDVTERKNAEQEIALLNQSLEEKVEERTMQLEQSNRALESFSSMAAHDLQAPLRILSGYAAILKNEYHDDLKEDARELLNTIILKTKHMSKLVSDLLNFSRVSHTMMREEKVDFDEMVRDIADQLALADSHPAKAEIVIQKLCSYRCDSGLMSQVWANLISNALKYSGKKEKPVIEIGKMDAPGETIFYIKDNGTGFDMQYADHLFDVFRRLHSESEYEGNCIGLALVKQVITRHKGRIWAEAVPQLGATFYFSLPD